MIIHLCHFININHFIIRLCLFIIISHLGHFIEVIECIAGAKRHLQQAIDDHKELTVNSPIRDLWRRAGSGARNTWTATVLARGKQGVVPATLGLRQSWREVAARPDVVGVYRSDGYPGDGSP